MGFLFCFYFFKETLIPPAYCSYRVPTGLLMHTPRERSLAEADMCVLSKSLIPVSVLLKLYPKGNSLRHDLGVYCIFIL